MKELADKLKDNNYRQAFNDALEFSEFWRDLEDKPYIGEVVLAMGRSGRVRFSIWDGKKFTRLPCYFRVKKWRRMQNTSESVILTQKASEFAIQMLRNKSLTSLSDAIEIAFKEGYKFKIKF